MKTIPQLMSECETAALDALCRYKFERFGYHASQWVMLNKLLAKPKPSPFRDLVAFSRHETNFKTGGRANADKNLQDKRRVPQQPGLMH